MTDLDDVARLASAESGLCVVSTSRTDGTIQSSVVNAGVLEHPITHVPVVGLVARGDSRKLVHLRARPHATVVVRSGWEWAACEGTAVLVGPGDLDVIGDPTALASLLRDVFRAAGGSHDDWDTYDRVMAAERRTAILVTPTRIYSNG
jgi:PPOX class probable F420-dependent enzyme